jgi:hypothetical protein
MYGELDQHGGRSISNVDKTHMVERSMDAAYFLSSYLYMPGHLCVDGTWITTTPMAHVITVTFGQIRETPVAHVDM